MFIRFEIVRAAIVSSIVCTAFLSVARADGPSTFVVARHANVAAVALDDGTLVIVDTDDGALLRRLALGETVLALDIAPNGELVAALTSTGALHFWRWGDAALEGTQRPKPFVPFGALAAPAPGEAVDELHFAPDGERVLIGVAGGEAKVIDRHGVVLGTLQGARNFWVSAALAWDARGERIAYADADGVSVVDGRTLLPLRTEGDARIVVREAARVKCLEFHPTEPRLATGHADGRIRVTDLITGAVVQVLEHDDPFYGLPPKQPVVEDALMMFPGISWLAHSRDGTRLAYTTVTGVHLGCFDLARGHLIAMSPFLGGRMGVPATIAWGPRDRRVFYAFWNGNQALTSVWFGPGQRYRESSAPGGTPKFGAGRLGVFVSGNDLQAIDGVSGELGWKVTTERLARGELQAPR